MMQYSRGIGVAISLILIIIGVTLNVIKSPFLILGLAVMLVLWGYVSLCRVLTANALRRLGFQKELRRMITESASSVTPGTCRD